MPQAVPECERATEVRELNEQGRRENSWCPVGRWAGRIYIQSTDPRTRTAQTKRGVREAVSSIYDPMGFLQSPLTIRCRMLVQELVRRGASWDESLSNEQASGWGTGCEEVPSVSHMKIQRCLLPADFASSLELSCTTLRMPLCQPMVQPAT